MRKHNKKILLTIMFAIAFLICACNQKSNIGKKSVEKPEMEQIRSICNLATLNCYYHNVAKSTKKAGNGILNWGEKDRTFWIEYTGIVKMGIDMTKVNMVSKGTKLYITMPEAEVLNISIEEKSFNKKSFIKSEDGLNENRITADDQTKALEKAQKDMRKKAASNSALLANAKDHAKYLIENYVNEIGKDSDTKYSIEWQDVNEDEKEQDSTKKKQN